MENGVAISNVDLTVCNTGCANQLHNFNGLFIDPETDRCYQRCFETPSELCAEGEIVNPTLLKLDTTIIAASNPLLVNMFCPYNQQTVQAFLLGSADATPPVTGYRIDLSSDSCSSVSPTTTVCRGRGTVVASGNSVLCSANQCDLTYAAFVGMTNNPNSPPAVGSPCFYECAVEPDTCIGYSSDCPGFCSGEFAYAGTVTTAIDAVACINTVCWQGNGFYNGYSFGGSGVVPCPTP